MSVNGDWDGLGREERDRERRQSWRGGSAVTALVATGRSLIGEGLRADGLAVGTCSHRRSSARQRGSSWPTVQGAEVRVG
jgi:hypothetical protein